MCVTKLCLDGHQGILATSILEQSLPDILVANQNGEYLETSRILLASSSNIIGKLLLTQPTADCIIIPDTPFRPVQLMIELLQHGCVSSTDSQEAAEAMDLAKHLQVPGTFSLVKEESPEYNPTTDDDSSNYLVHIDDSVHNLVALNVTVDHIVEMDDTGDHIDAENLVMVEDDEMEDDDVFTTSGQTVLSVHQPQQPQRDPQQLEDHDEQHSSEYSVLNNNYALDLSPSSRLKFKSPSEKYFSFEFPRTESSTHSQLNSATLSRDRSNKTSGNTRTNSLQRSRKPPPLKYLSVSSGAGGGVDCQLPAPHTPWTPLAASPVIEERFKKIVQQQKEKENEEKLRNLSVSSADFENSLPNTPNQTRDNLSEKKKKGTGSKNSTTVTTFETTSPDVDHAYYCAEVKTEQCEPVDSEQLNNDSEMKEDKIHEPEPSGSLHSTQLIISEPGNSNTPIASPSDGESSNSQHHQPNELSHLSELLVPSLAKTLSPIQQILFFRHQKMLQRDRESNNSLLSPIPGSSKAVTKKSSNSEESHLRPDLVTSNANPQHKTKPSEGEGRFKCERCGKCYNWNYNLNRHMRFECGIGHRFQCGVCKRRFPHKQNAAIHLKRKHLLQMDSAEEMLASGHIILLSKLTG